MLFLTCHHQIFIVCFLVDEKFLGDKLEHMYKIVHIVNFSTSIQALSLLYQVMGAG